MNFRRMMGFALFSLWSVAFGGPEFTIKENAPATGTHIQQNAVTSRVPLNKKYSELTAAERNSFRAQYADLPDGDEPPYPANGLERIAKDMVKIQQAVLATGELFVTIEVDPNGKGKNVKFYKIPDSAMAKAVAFSLLSEKYKPAKCSGKPCVMEFPFTFEFKVR